MYMIMIMRLRMRMIVMRIYVPSGLQIFLPRSCPSSKSTCRRTVPMRPPWSASVWHAVNMCWTRCPPTGHITTTSPWSRSWATWTRSVR